MRDDVAYQIRLTVAGEPGWHAFDVLEIGGVPHAVVDRMEKLLRAVPLDPAKIHDLEGDHMFDRMTAGYRDAVDLSKAVEFPR